MQSAAESLHLLNISWSYESSARTFEFTWALLTKHTLIVISGLWLAKRLRVNLMRTFGDQQTLDI